MPLCREVNRLRQLVVLKGNQIVATLEAYIEDNSLQFTTKSAITALNTGVTDEQRVSNWTMKTMFEVAMTRVCFEDALKTPVSEDATKCPTIEDMEKLTDEDFKPTSQAIIESDADVDGAPDQAASGAKDPNEAPGMTTRSRARDHH